MTRRRCSHCNTSNGHNARTCSSSCGGGGGGGLKLFGVRLMDVSSIKKSASMGNLSHYCAAVDSMEGYHSDYLNYSLMADRGRLRKKGIPWTEEEHRQFLVGLHKLGRGNWRGIARNYVPSRTPTQVASHAQKYFIRQSNSTEKKKRPSLFDLAPDTEANASMPEQSKASKDEKSILPSYEGVDIKSYSHSLDLSLKLAFTPFPFQIRREETMKMSQLTLGESSEAKVAPL